MDDVALLRAVHEPYERGESADFGPVWDLLVDDVRYESPAGPVHGRQAVIDYFDHAAETIDFWPFERPVEYFDNGDHVIMLGEELITEKATGAQTRGEWLWVLTMDAGKITRIAHFLRFDDLSLLLGALRRAYEQTTARGATT
ncbi:nuclear transport factor 2 family protein [Conexibacter woesei]|uniref:SnoaL-like domain-containing protein n=1 Tax=Conexibacter woesei (strain DSM 14684 / CCUG 47730 / CIP 108061 / JCM 11494 / NBRC 100937 / ID131577) TaxID=469383 RepID=D3F4H9_CONWI|nr:nuclear transport factor 2 family protein [Conexibacter woesei]ADB52436.1 hypothetical protein Cwoe_4019 [Conexibacter woesei DSM 14684]